MRIDVFADEYAGNRCLFGDWLACPAEARDNSPPSPVGSGVAAPLALRAKAGGARRDRTDDLMLAKHALSQLSYGPVF